MKPSTRKLHYPLPQSDLAIGADSWSGFVARRNKAGKYVPFAWYPQVQQVAAAAVHELVLDAGPENEAELKAANDSAIKRLSQALAPQFKVVV